MKWLLFKARLFRHQFHPLNGIDVVHQLNENGVYECSYLVFLRSPFSSEVLLRIRYNRDDVFSCGRVPRWLTRLL